MIDSYKVIIDFISFVTDHKANKEDNFYNR